MNNKKRFISLLLVLCMMFSTMLPITALAADENNPLGEFSLTIKQVYDVTDTEFNVELVGAKTFSGTTSMTTGRGNYAALSFSGIPKGEYTLRVDGGSFLAYEQKINFNDDCVNIALFTEGSVNDSIADGQTKFGVIAIGDVTDDGVIDDADANAVIDAIGTKNAKFDVDGSGVVDLTDLAYVVRNYDGNVEAQPYITVSSLTILAQTEVTVPENVTATVGGCEEGEELSIQEAILSPSADTYVALAPADPEAGITAENPVEISIDMPVKEEAEAAPEVSAEAVVIAPPSGSENSITEGTVSIVGVDLDTGDEIVFNAAITPETEDEANGAVVAKVHNADGESAAAAKAVATQDVQEVRVESDGSVVINIGKRVAIKRITINVTGTTSGKLAEIAKVEFLGDFADRVPEPQLSIPTVIKESIKNTNGKEKSLTFSWTPQTNVAYYEISISGNGLNVVRTTEQTTYTFQSDSFNGKLDTFKSYVIKVRSVSGDWKSGWSEPVSYMITTTDKPPKPEYLSVNSGVLCLDVSWRALYDTEKYSLFYKAVGDGAYTEIKNITSSSCRISGLVGGKEYEVYVVAHNRNGSSAPSAHATGVALTATGVEMPYYGMINTADADGNLMNHIVSINGNRNKSYTIYKEGGATVTNNNATSEDWKAIADNDPSTYLVISDWDSGVYYANFRGPIIQLDGKYKINTIRMAPSANATCHVSQVTIGYKNDAGKIVQVATSFNRKYDKMNRTYYEIVFNTPVTTDYLEVRTTTGYGSPITISELRLYYYDTLMDDVDALFTDNTQIALRPEVTQDTIDALIDRANKIDEATGEYNPRRATALVTLSYAQELFDCKALGDPIKVDTSITSANDGSIGFAMSLSSNQPLGYVASAGDTVVIYVGSKTEALGTKASLMLTVSQYHPEVSSWSKDVKQLVVGRNEIQLPAITSVAKEKGGSLYVWYGSSVNGKTYNVRVMGATKIPMLNVDGVTGEARTQAIEKYVSELEAYVPTIPTLHEELHVGKKNTDYAYNQKECIFNSTEICMENMVFSVPASQVLAAIKGYADPAAQLEKSIEAMEQEIDLFYQFKGLNKNVASTDTDRYPNQRLNIRYHQMFTGAFMYAGGKHIGIEWGSVPGLFSTSPIVTDENGKRLSGGYSGWGIAHEIGHVINAGSYVVGEVTNNVFAQLAKTDETSATFRTTYENVYKGVVAGNTGHTGNLAVQLAMYWQLHLAYDNDYSFKFYNTAAEQQEALFYARVESYLRNKAKAKAATGFELVLNSNSDNNFMRACCAAAKKDLLDFFRAWGLTPNAETVAYAANFEKETRKIQYIDDDSRLYRMTNGEGMSEGTVVTAQIANAVNSRINSNKVTINFSNNNTNDDAILGYEICRNGKVVAFVMPGKTSYTDVIATENNKTFVYTVTAIDRLLNETETVVLPEVKVCHDGSISKAKWSATTNLSSADDSVIEAGEDTGYCENAVVSAVTATFDNDSSTVFAGTTKAASAEIVISLGGTEQITALKYAPGGNNPIGAYTIAVSADGTTWETVKTGTFNDTDVQTVFFNKVDENGEMDPWMYIYDAAYVKLTANNQKTISLNEIDILGPTSDNVELVDGGFGKLAQDFVYSDGADDVIPAGAILFYGAYKGDPSYNVVVLKDQDGNIINGSQIILAEVPERGCLGETSDGRWIYYLDGEEDLEGITSVQAELYRVQDAFTLEGQRLTSTSLHFTIPEDIPDVTIETAANVPAFSNSMPEADDEATGEVAATFNASANDEAVAAEVNDDEAAEEEVNYAKPITMTADSESKTVSFSINSAYINQPIAAHFAINISAKFGGLDVKWTIDDNNVFCAYRFNKNTGVLDLYVVAKNYVLNDFITGVISVNDIASDVYAVSFAADIIDTIGRGYTVAAKGVQLDEIADIIVKEAPEREHNWVAANTVEPTCTTGGYTEYICVGCAEVEIRDVTPAAGHTFSKWAVEKEATCKDAGLEKRVCTTCGKVETKVIPATGAHIDEDEDGICDVCGEKIDSGSDKECVCICHSEGGFLGFIAKLIRFIWKICGRYPKCICGKAHY